MKKEKLLITVKTYPVLSTKYQETVCTAGLREDGSWVRLYPIPFRLLPEEQQFKKYEWIECVLYERKDDPRPESFSPTNVHEIETVGHIDTRQNWLERRMKILDKARVYRKFEPLIQEAKKNLTSLAIFKPTELLNFYAKPAEMWSTEKIRKTQAVLREYDLFDDNEWRKTYSLPAKIPYDFFYEFLDETGKRSNLKIHDWEAGMLFLELPQGGVGRSRSSAEES